MFQSAMIGGGYGTGREVVEYFSAQGAMGGLLGIAVATVVLGVVLSVTYEFARCFAVYDYRRFFQALIGPGWWAYEAIYVIAVVLVLAVIGAAASSILDDQLGWPTWIGTTLMLVAITAMAAFGRNLVAYTMTIWAVLLSAIFALYFVLTLTHFGPEIVRGLEASTVTGHWASKGLQFALYNVAMAPALLFSARAIRTSREAMLAGWIAALAAILPAALFHLSFASRQDEVIGQALPTYWMIAQLHAGWFMVIYLIGLFGTLIQTGIGLIQGLIERVDEWRAELGRVPLTRFGHAALAAFTICLSGLLSVVGIISLVARGYSFLAWAFLLVYHLPLITIGLVRIARTESRAALTSNPSRPDFGA